jgi:hypothetical protein
MAHVVLALLFLLAIAFAETGAEASQWTTRQDSRFGFSYSYPAELFAPTEGERSSFHYFGSEATDAKFIVGAWNNEEGVTPQQFKQWMLTHAEGYEDITYQPRGRAWFVLSGHRGDQIYYEKAIFSCSGRVVNVLAIAYPEAERQRFDPVVERMEDNFKSGRGCG